MVMNPFWTTKTNESFHTQFITLDVQNVLTLLRRSMDRGSSSIFCPPPHSSLSNFLKYVNPSYINCYLLALFIFYLLYIHIIILCIIYIYIILYINILCVSYYMSLVLYDFMFLVDVLGCIYAFTSPPYIFSSIVIFYRTSPFLR